MDTCVSLPKSFCCPLETITVLLTDYTPIQNKNLGKKKRKHPVCTRPAKRFQLLGPSSQSFKSFGTRETVKCWVVGYSLQASSSYKSVYLGLSKRKHVELLVLVLGAKGACEKC